MNKISEKGKKILMKKIEIETEKKIISAIKSEFTENPLNFINESITGSITESITD